MNLRTHITILFIVLIGVPALLIVLLSISNASQAILQQATNQMNSLANAKEAELGVFIEGQYDRVRGISSRTRMREALEGFIQNQNEDDRNTLRKIIVDAGEPFEDVHGVHVLDVEGNSIVSVTGGEHVHYENNGLFFERALEREFVFFDKSIDGVVAAGPIEKDGRTLGIIIIESESSVLVNLLRDYTGLGETGEVLIAGRTPQGDAEFLHTRRFENDQAAQAVIPKENLHVPMTQALLNNETVLFNAVDYRGERVIAGTRYIESVDWGLVVKIDEAELVEVLHDFRVTLFILAITILIFTGVIAYSVSFSLTRPIEFLTRETKRMVEGDFNVNVPKDILETRNEIGILSRAFVKMTTSLKDVYGNLENKVRQRTQQLDETLTQMKGQNDDLEEAKAATLNILEDLQEEREKIALAQAKDESVLLSLGEALVVTDEAGTITMVNNVFEDLLGLGVENVRGKNIDKVVPVVDESGELVDPEDRLIKKVLKKGSADSFAITETVHYKNANGKVFPASTTVSPIVMNDGIIGAVEVFSDITKEKEVDKAKTEFVSLASHQLRTPLSAINWYSEMLLAGDAGDLSDEQKEYVDQIYTGNQRMVELVNALLNVSRLELGTFSVEPEEVSVTDIADNVAEELKSLTNTKNIVLDKKFGNVPHIISDPQLVRIIIQNLLSNAVKYTPEKGNVTITIESEDDQIHVSVSDTGYGIPEEQQKMIFSKLFRADNVRKTDTEGTGLGLYIVKAIVEVLGGRISFVSEENKGTTFDVWLPQSGVQKKEGNKKLI